MVCAKITSDEDDITHISWGAYRSFIVNSKWEKSSYVVMNETVNFVENSKPFSSKVSCPYN